MEGQFLRQASIDQLSRSPVLLQDELIMHTQEHVNIEDSAGVAFRDAGIARVTSHRIIWIGSGASVALPLVQARSAKEHGSWMSRRRIEVQCTTSDGKIQGCVRLFFNSGGRTEFMEKLSSSLKSRLWEAVTAPSDTRSQTAGGGDGIGIAALKARHANRLQESSQFASDALRDVDALAHKARELGEMIKTYAELNKHNAGGGSAGAGQAPGDDMAAMMLELGIDAPVTKEASGNMYFRDLSRHLASFLSKQLQRCGGIMSLADVYCIYNRTRGTNLVSPDDLLKACSLFTQLGLPCQLVTFESGVRAVQLASHSREAVWQRLSRLLREAPFMTAYNLANELQIPLAIAEQHLLNAEADAKLCRDESLHGIRFYENRFTPVHDW